MDEEIALEPQTKREAKMMLGHIAMKLIYEDGRYPQDAATLMIDTSDLRQLFAMAGYIDTDGVINYSTHTLELWAGKAHEEKLRGDRRSVTNMVFTRQLTDHLRVQRALRDAILRDGKLHQAERYTTVSRLIAQMLPGMLQTDSTTININNSPLTEERKQEIIAVKKSAQEQVEAFEQRLLNGEIVD